MKFRTRMLAIAAVLMLAVCASSAIAYAEPAENGEDDATLTAQTSFPSSYAILKKDGYLHRTDASHSIDYGVVWGDNWGDLTPALDAVTTLFIDADVQSISNGVKVRSNNNGDEEIKFYGGWGYTGPHNLQTVEFLLKDGKNQLQVIGGTYQVHFFNSQESLTTVKNLEKTQLINIPSYMFCNCTALKSISIPSTAVKIGESAFDSCKSLSSVTIPSGVSTIEKNAFNGCVVLKSVDLPASVRSLGGDVFRGCSSLSKAIMRSDTVVDGYSSEFNGTQIHDESADGRIYVPNNLLSQYKMEGSSNKWGAIRDRFYPFFAINPIGTQTYTGSAIKPAATVT